MKPEIKKVKLSDVVFDESIYPREAHKPEKAQEYSECLEIIEAAGKYISVSSDLTLLDGKHRWLGYRIANKDNQDIEIPVYSYDVSDIQHKLALAYELNNNHGIQLTVKEKEDGAKRLYSYGFSQETIARMLSVSLTTVNRFLARTLKEEKEKQNKQIWDMWLACHTQEEIAEAVGGISRDTVTDRLKVLGENYRGNFLPKVLFHEDDWKPPIYNVWKVQETSGKVRHPGNTEPQWVDNLLYLYTKPLDIVIDPFAGGGSTIDICKKRGRRYWVSDRKPIIAREQEIRQLDITESLPSIGNRWNEVGLVYLDPPYWKQVEGKYSEDPTDLANMSLEDFTNTLSGLICKLSKKLPAGAHIALIIQPTQWSAPDRQYTDHVADMIRLVKLPIDMRIQAPYESQQANAQMVTWAKENRKVLVLSREIIIWRVV